MQFEIDDKVHEMDIVKYYPLLKEYLIQFGAGPDGLPDLEHHKAPKYHQFPKKTLGHEYGLISRWKSYS